MRKHLSPTQIESYHRCPEAYRRRYIEGEIIPPGIALLQGKAFHGAAGKNFAQKIESREDLPVAEIQEIAAEKFAASVRGGYMLTDEEENRGTHRVLGEAKDATVEMAGFHAKEQAPDYQPILVEEKIRIELPGAKDLLGIIDLADDKDRVVDFKTVGRSKNQNDADTSVQLTTYAAAFRAKMGRAPAEVRLDTVVRTKRSISRDVQISQRTPPDFGALAHRINAISQAIDAGAFPPTLPGSWQCSDRFCGYWRTCKYVNSERRAAAEKENGDG